VGTAGFNFFAIANGGTDPDLRRNGSINEFLAKVYHPRLEFRLEMAAERSPLGSRSEDVRMDLADRQWASAGGEGGAIPTAAPLDELSFLFFIRTLPLEAGATYDLNRHFDTRRNPVQVRVLGRQRTTVPAGEFQTVAVEMRVHDPARYKERKQAVIRLYLTDDERRIPVRIESSMPYVGSVTMALQSASPAGGGSAN